MKILQFPLLAGLAAAPAARACHRRRRRALGRGRRPVRRHHRRLARQFLYRRVDRAKNGADGGALRAARRRLQDRRIWRGPAAALQDVRNVAIHPGFSMQAMTAHRATADVALAAARCAAQGQGRIVARHAAIFRSWPAAASPSPASASPSAATARAAAPFASLAWSRPASPARCKFAWSIPWARARATGSAPAPAIPAARCSKTSQGGPAIVGVVSWSTGPNGAAGCGGMTGVTPLTLYRDWILQTARQWGSAL